LNLLNRPLPQGANLSTDVAMRVNYVAVRFDYAAVRFCLEGENLV
jgi:hypothetical protein